MEVTSKHLHKHALPVVMLLLAFGLISAACYGYFAQMGPNGQAELARGFVSQVVHIRPSANGLAHVTIGTDQSQATIDQAQNAGQSAELSLSLGSGQ